MIRSYLLVFCILLFACSKKDERRKESLVAGSVHTTSETRDSLKVSFTFDDGITYDLAGYEFENWNQMILNNLKKEGIQAAFFVTGANKRDQKGQYLLRSWADEGHLIANHSYTHPNFNSKELNKTDFEIELLKTDSIISKYTTHKKLFRFPYLNAGKTSDQAQGYQEILIKHKYRGGRVTIDNSEWYINSQLIKCIRKEGMDSPKIERYKDYYIQHILEKADYYERLSFAVSKRHIKHTLLLHHNLTSALFLPDLIKAFREKGWQIVSAEEAFKDPFFDRKPAVIPAGESLAYAAAKASGNHEHLLLFSAEDGGREAEKMKKLGL